MNDAQLEVATPEVLNAFEGENKPQVTRDAKGNIIVVQDGKVIATVKAPKVKKVGYGEGLRNHFTQKNLARIEAKKAKAAA